MSRSKTTYHRVIISAYLLFILSFFSKAQQGLAFSDSVKKLVDSAELYINQYHNPEKSFLKIERAEKLAKQTNDPVDLLRVYRIKAFFYHVNHNDELSSRYVQKCKETLKYCRDSLEIALCYEVLGILAPNGSDASETYYLKALNIFKKYDKPEHLIDINYNLAVHYYFYKKEKDWEKAINASLEGLNAIKESGKEKDKASFFYIYLLESYMATGNYKNAQQTIHSLDSIRNQKEYNSNNYLEYLYLTRTARYYYQTGKYQKSADLNVSALHVIDSLRKIELDRLNKAASIEKKLHIKEAEIKRIEIENQLKKIQIKVGLIIIAFITVLLIVLVLVSIYLKKSSKKVKAINQILEKQNTDLEIMTEKLGTALKAKTDFLNVMTHELFTPINGIAIITHNLKTETDIHCFNQNLDLLEFSSNYLYRLLKNIVDTKSIDNQNDLILNIDAVHLKSLIKTVAQTATIFLKTSTNTFRYHIDNNIPDPLLIDSVKLSQILINLLNNANKFTTNGNITLEVKMESETETKTKILFNVTDTGIGIDTEFLSNIFEKFEHGSDEIKEKYGGSGIGLYVVKHFLLLHDSKIHVSSEKEKGTTFSFSIWFDKVHKSTAKDSVTGSTAGNILLVDDNKVNLVVTKKLLESFGYKCNTVENGWDALKILKDNSYDLILMDIMMPGINGFETTQRIKQANIQTPVVALTAVDIEQNREDFERTGFEAVISKPFELDDFLKVVKEAIAGN